MRTTLDIDDDVLETVKTLAKAEKKTAGEVVSELIRKAMTDRAALDVPSLEVKDGFFLLPDRGGVAVTKELVDRLVEEEDLESIRRASQAR